jgi:hypothetical protein
LIRSTVRLAIHVGLLKASSPTYWCKTVIREIQSTGVASHRGIARSLNSRGVATAHGGAWTAAQVGSILRRAETH